MNEVTGGLLTKFKGDGTAEGGLTFIDEGLELTGELDGATVHIATEPADVAIKWEKDVILAVAVREVKDGGRITSWSDEFCGHLLTIWDPVFMLIE